MTFAEGRRSYWTGVTAYGAHWNEAVEIPAAITNLAISNRPTVNTRAEAELRKYTMAHEYGHVQTLLPLLPIWQEIAPLFNYCAPNSCDQEVSTLGHDRDSVEWQAAAAIEGFAHFYAMSVWNELTDVGVLAQQGPQLWEIVANKSTDTYTNSTGTYDSLLQFKTTDSCTMMDAEPCPECVCDLGVWTDCNCSSMAIELDWGFFLWDLLGGSPALSIDTVMKLLGLSYTLDSDWPEAGDPDWWSEFQSDAQSQFGTMAEQSRISDEAANRGIDQ
ncbi:hypothetical protein [Enhygromyxa salina]|nr:hypothetical protein [Enhygromyxa salina]